MSIKTKVIGLNKFLASIYDTDMRISILLSEIGYDARQIQYLRQNCLEKLVDGCILLINQRIVAYSDGVRLNKVISQRYGLDGQPSQTLQTIGNELHISRERVRQLEQKVIRRFRGRKNHQLIEAGLKVIADDLLLTIPTVHSSPEDSSELEIIPEMEESRANPEPIETIIHAFDFEETQKGNFCLVIRESRADNNSAQIRVHEDEIEQFYLDFRKSMRSVGWQKHLKAYQLTDIRKQYPRAYEEWTEDEEARLKEMFEEQREIADIANFLERQPGAIRSRLSKLNLRR